MPTHSPENSTPASDNRIGPPVRSRAERETRLRNGLTICAMSLLVLVLCYVILQELTSILRPFMVAVFVCYLIVPAHHWLVRKHVPSMLSYFIVIGGFLTVMYGVSTMTFNSLREMSAEVPSYIYKLQASVDEATLHWETRLTRLMDRETEDLANVPPPPTNEAAPTISARASSTTAPATQPRRASFEIISADQLIGVTQSTLSTFFGIFTSAIVVVFYMIFLLAEEAGFDRRLINALGPERAAQTKEVISKINTAVARYISVKTFISLMVGLLSMFILFAFGVKYALIWGVLTFFFNFVPYVGSYAAASLPILMSLVQFNDLWRPAIIAVLLILAQTVTGSILEPRLLGKRLGVSPLVILLSLAFWGYLWGIPGMILSAPLIVTIKIILENIESTRPLAKLASNV